MKGANMRLISFFLGLILVFSLTNCASYDFSRRIVEQGNLIPPGAVERLKIGMNKEDTAILMGTSLLSPMFDNDRWDYAFTRRKGSGPMEIRNLTLFFNQDSLVQIKHKP